MRAAAGEESPASGAQRPGEGRESRGPRDGFPDFADEGRKLGR